jgi:hypothetical protein
VRVAGTARNNATPLSHVRRAAAKFPPPPGSVPPPDFSSQPLLPPPGESSQPAPKGGFFSLEPYKRFFNVDTADVLYRLRLACLPVGSRFMETVQENPDLCVQLPPYALLCVGVTRARLRYGPFWVAATLVFLAAASGNMSTYFAYCLLYTSDAADDYS